MDYGRFTKATFRKASGSGDTGCVEVAFVGDAAGIRDSKRREDGLLVFDRREWVAFTDGVKSGEFDLST